MSASWKISPAKRRGYREKERRGVVHNEACTGKEIVYAFLCVSGDGRDTVHIRGLKKKRTDTFGCGVTEMEREEPT